MSRKAKYTLWTNPMSNWTAFPDVVITPAIEKAVKEEVKKVSDKKIQKRTKPYETPVTSATLRAPNTVSRLFCQIGLHRWSTPNWRHRHCSRCNRREQAMEWNEITRKVYRWRAY